MSKKTDMSSEAVTHRLKQMEGLWLLGKALAEAKVLRKNPSRKNRSLEIQSAIRDILLQELNPSAPNQGVAVDRSLDENIAPILRILVGTRREDDLVECLQRITNKKTGSETRDLQRLRQMAESLLGLDVKLN
jgi:hypothetical protein